MASVQGTNTYDCMEMFSQIYISWIREQRNREVWKLSFSNLWQSPHFPVSLNYVERKWVCWPCCSQLNTHNIISFPFLLFIYFYSDFLLRGFVLATPACCQCRVGVTELCRQQVLAGESRATVEGTLVFFSLNSSHLRVLNVMAW